MINGAQKKSQGIPLEESNDSFSRRVFLKVVLQKRFYGCVPKVCWNQPLCVSCFFIFIFPTCIGTNHFVGCHHDYHSSTTHTVSWIYTLPTIHPLQPHCWGIPPWIGRVVQGEGVFNWGVPRDSYKGRLGNLREDYGESPPPPLESYHWRIISQSDVSGDWGTTAPIWNEARNFGHEWKCWTTNPILRVPRKRSPWILTTEPST